MLNLLYVFICTAIVVNQCAWGDQLTENLSNTTVKKVKRCYFNNSKKRAPLWICKPQAEGLAIVAVGSSTKSKAGLAHMQQMALADARIHLAQTLSESAHPTTNAASESAEITKIANESLEGIKIIKSTSGPHGSLYVLIGIDEESAQKLREAISAKK
jgi:hypothetical protein